MLSRDDNEVLCRVGPGTPMGMLIRRYWFPAMLSSDLPEPGGAPKAVRLLGEDLVIFRETGGKIGLIDSRCPHRGVRLTLARNEGCGLRCIYHGWMVNAEGAVIDTPAEPEVSRFHRNVRTTAYTARDVGGLVWAYLGPPGQCPPFPEFELTALPPGHLVHAQIAARANFAQVLEETGYGFRYAALHRPLGGGEGQWWTRITQFVAPFYSFIPGDIFTAFVTVDDYNSNFFTISYSQDAPMTAETRREREEHFGVRMGIDLAADYTMLGRSEENNWGQDRAGMESGETFSGLSGLSIDDVAVQEAQGRIADRSRENLGAQDIAIVTMRRLLLASARRAAAGQALLSDPRTTDYRLIRPAMGMLQPPERWQDMDHPQTASLTSQSSACRSLLIGIAQ